MKRSVRRERLSGYMRDQPMVFVLGGIALLVLIVILVVYLAGGLAAEPRYFTWCDSPSSLDGQTVANRIYESYSGDITVVKEDKTC